MLKFLLKKKEKTKEKPTLGQLGIKQIKDNSFVMEDDSVHTILDVEPIDFFSMNQGKQNNIISQYLDFMKSLNFDIEIVVRTLNEDAEHRAELMLSQIEFNIKKKKSERLMNQFEAFSEQFQKTIKKNCALTRKCYIVINFNLHNGDMSSDYYWKLALEILKSRVEHVKKNLSSIGLKSERLNDEELINLFESYLYDSFHYDNEYKTPKLWLEDHKNA